MGIGPPIALHPDAAQRQHVKLQAECRGHLLRLGDQTGIGVLRARLLAAQHPNRQPRPRERMPPDQVVWQPERFAQGAHFVLVELIERLNDLALGQKPLDDADAIVVRLDDRCVFRAARLNGIRVERPLAQQPLVRVQGQRDQCQLAGADELLADPPPLFLWVGNSFCGGEKIFAVINDL